MPDTLTADLATGADDLESPEVSTEPQSLESMLDSAIDSEAPLNEPPADDPTAPDDNVDRGDGRNARGRWVGKGDDPKGAEAAKAPDAGAAPANTASLEAPKNTFKYRAMGQTHDSGAVVGEDGSVTFPPEKHGELREAFNALHQRQATFVPTLQKLESENQQLKQENESLKSGTGEHEAKAQALVNALTAALSEQDDEKSLGMLWELRGKFPQLLKDAEIAHLKGQLAKPATPAAPAKEESPYRPEPAMPTPDVVLASLRDTIETWSIQHFPKEHAFHGLTPADWQQIAKESEGTPFAFIRVATAEDAKQYSGVEAGQPVFDTDRLFAAVEKHATTQRAQRAAAASTAELAAKNARRTQATITAPPSAGGTQAPPKSGARQFKNKEEYEAWKRSDEIDDD